MQESEIALIRGVKSTVAQYGMTGVSTRKLSEVSGINNGLIYHYFASKEDLMLKAYCMENGALYEAMLGYLREVRDIPFDFRDKALLWFHRFWRELLRDRERLIFCSSYYHSPYFKEAAGYHKRQIDDVVKQIGGYFPSREACELTLNTILTIVYNFAPRVANGEVADTQEFEKQIFEICYGVLLGQMEKRPAS